MKKILCLFLAAAALGINATAATTETLRKTVDFSNITFGDVSDAKTNWRSTDYESYEIVDENGNQVAKMPGSSVLGTVDFSGNASNANNYRRATIDVKLPGTDAGSKMELFDYKNEYNVKYPASAPSTTPITLEEGGAYVIDYTNSSSGEQVWFIEKGTILPNEWYTVERILDLCKIGTNRQRARVYDAAGNILGTSPWTVCGTMGENGTYKSSFPSAFFKSISYAESIYLDNFEVYTIKVQNPTITASFNEEEKKIDFKFSEPLLEESVTKDNVVLEVENKNYTDAVSYDLLYDETTSTISVSYDRLPFGEKVKVTVKTTVQTAEGWNMASDTVKTYTIKDDPCICSGSITDTEGVKTATVTVTNGDETDRDYIVMLISKNAGGVITACKAVSGSVEAGQTANVTTEGITLAEGETAEMYVIDDWKNFRLMRN